MAEKQTILIVEDDLDLAEMLNAYFRVQGYEVLTAAWGEEAVRTCHEALPDIVVLDIRLPDIDGYEVCRQLRSHRKTENLPIIFLTERRDRVDRLVGLEMGVVDYITKPFDIQELRLRVRNALKRAGLETLVNPITGLPEGPLVDERLSQLLSASGWAVIILSVRHLDTFRETYGFVASDDVLRAVSLMINNAVREFATEGDFVGHLNIADFVVVTLESRAREYKERVSSRVGPSMEYFYPLKDREAPPDESRLSLSVGVLTAHSGPFQDLDALKTALLRSRGAM